jgi:hypothetical protein
MFSDGLGHFIFLYGLLWFIVGLFHVTAPEGWRALSLLSSVGMMVFGYCLWDYGIFTALAIAGGYTLFMSVIASSITLRPPYVGFVALLVMMISWGLRDGETPVRKYPKFYQPVTYDGAVWDVGFIIEVNGDERRMSCGRVVGTEEDAYWVARIAGSQYRYSLWDFDVKLVSCPKEYCKSYLSTEDVRERYGYGTDGPLGPKNIPDWMDPSICKSYRHNEDRSINFDD